MFSSFMRLFCVKFILALSLVTAGHAGLGTAPRKVSPISKLLNLKKMKQLAHAQDCRAFSYRTTFKDFTFELPFEWILEYCDDDEDDGCKGYVNEYFDSYDQPEINFEWFRMERIFSLDEVENVMYNYNLADLLKVFGWDVDEEIVEFIEALIGSPEILSVNRVTIQGIDMLECLAKIDTTFGEDIAGSPFTQKDVTIVYKTYSFLDGDNYYSAELCVLAKDFAQIEPTFDQVVQSIQRK